MTYQQDQARQQIRELIKQFSSLTPNQLQQTTEADVTHHFITPLFKALGWPTTNHQRYKYEQTTISGRPDITFFPQNAGTIFIEAKRFGKIHELAISRKTLSGTVTPGQMALPGMATDRTPEEQQAINYAFQNHGTWAILTNFQRLRLFNARRDWLVLSFESPRAYLDDFDLLWALSYQSIQHGSLDNLSHQRHREDVDTNYLDFINEWREKLAQDIVANPQQNRWAFNSDGTVNLDQLRAVVQRILDRLVVVRFAEDHLIIPSGTLYQFYELSQSNPYTFSLSEFFSRLYRRFDQYHNSNLFAPGPADHANFSDDVLSGLVRKLYEARYRAMSADIMGNTYEQYLGKTLVHKNGNVATADNLETRKKQGSYYTPQVIVRYLVDNSLGRYLYGTANGKPDGEPLPGESRKTVDQIEELRCIDPACGSGGFLIYAYQVLADYYRSEIRRLEEEREQRSQELYEQGLTAPFDISLHLTPYKRQLERLRDYPHIILENHLYGVDLDPQAAELATVNLIMRAMADRSGHSRLPLILNQNIKVGNSLIGAGPDDPRYEDHAGELAELRRLRLALRTGESDDDHDAILAEIAQIEYGLNTAINEDLQEYFQDPGAHRPFHWAVEFPEVFVDEEGKHQGDTAGFDVIVGNPPWEIVKPDYREYYAQFDPDIESKLTRRKAEQRVKQLNAENPEREQGWLEQKAHIEEAAVYYNQSGVYRKQGRGDTATHKLFIEREFELLASDGHLALVVPSGIYSDLGTLPLREMLLKESRIHYLYGLANVRGFFPEVDSRFKFTLLGTQKGGTTEQFKALFLLSHADWPLTTDEYDSSAVLANVIHDENRVIDLSRHMLEQFSPESLSVMEFKSAKDYEITERLYDQVPTMGESIENHWNPKLASELHMTNARHLFQQENNGLPLYEGKTIHQFNAYYSEPRYWVSETSGRSYLLRREEDVGQELHYQRARLAYRDIARSTDYRTLIGAILPPNVFAGNTLILETDTDGSEMLFLVSMLNSYAIDFLIRYKVGTHVSMFYAYQLPVPRLTPGNPYFDAIVPRAARLTCTTPEFADLWQEVMEEPWDASKGATDEDERQRLRNELDAIIAHLYGLSRDDFAHILGTFPLVFPDDEAGRAKKEELLGVYDEFEGHFS